MQNTVVLDSDSEVIKYLSDKDKRLAKVIDMVGTIAYELYENFHAFIIHEIRKQMFFVKASAKIYSLMVLMPRCLQRGGSLTP